MSVPKSFLDILKNCTLDQMQAMSVTLTNRINQIKGVINDPASYKNYSPASYVDIIPDFISDDVIISGLKDDLDNIMSSNRSSNSVTSQWLAYHNEPYIFGNKSYNAMDLKYYPSIIEIMNRVNLHPLTSGDMNSCLINRYENNGVAGRLHSDNEKIISQYSSICTISVGPTRTIDFRKNNNNPIVKSLELTSGSMFIMKPGCQKSLKHKLNKDDELSGVRYSISFRKSVSPDEFNEPPVVDQQANDELPDIDHEKLTSQTPEGGQIKNNSIKIPTVLIAGDSITKNLHASKIGKKHVRVDNISVGGHNMHRTLKSIEEYHEKNKDTVKVTKVFVSVGCNDIRFVYSRGVNHLKAPLTRLILTIKDLFPSALIFFHSVLPVRIQNRWTDINVCKLNDILKSYCHFHNIYYLNFFRLFLTRDGNRNDNMFRDDVHPKNSCMGLFAMYYIKIIHNNDDIYFNPDIISRLR